MGVHPCTHAHSHTAHTCTCTHAHVYTYLCMHAHVLMCTHVHMLTVRGMCAVGTEAVSCVPSALTPVDLCDPELDLWAALSQHLPAGDTATSASLVLRGFWVPRAPERLHSPRKRKTGFSVRQK